jgi:rare lipoprotein A
VSPAHGEQNPRRRDAQRPPVASAAAASSRVVARRRGVRRILRQLSVLAALAVACGAPQRPPPPPKRTGAVEAPVILRGLATVYGREAHGGPTASGERFDMRQMTAAHRTLPFGTRVRVTNTRNGRSVEVRINDRGPYGGNGRIIDLSEAAARRLDMIDAGVVPVTVEVLR